MKITMYSTTTCGYCVMLKDWLQKQHIDFTEYKVDQNPLAAQQMIQLSGQMGVPFTTIEADNGTVTNILGYDVPAFKKVLSIS